ncbi:MAG TPA: type II toxin-antitoxin system PemK/MazF family toxin [Bryobacteraceae bacterium]|nr:type II toxin-antitoxin system PemK/MazF family toxin [Bryobacteraceae bacterium]
MVSDVRQGEVYWIDFGPTGRSAPAERHPCVVVQSDLFNRSLIATTVICLITSNQRRSQAPGNVRLQKGDANLPKASVVNVTRILTVDKAELTERLGRLPAAAIDAIANGLHLLVERV